ncbi:MAG: bacteriophage abortive infection AbiH family protein [Desulfovibrio sp.]|uniref:bacteriophage abortive infection AbiH family protein n=1 Tax=Desulfovibrio sp. 7SRBS1 TaxID=3378064 RepID=UPI003B3C7F55
MLRAALQNGLYIIGNGFDLHHNLNTSYGAFATWLKDNHSSLYDRCLKYLMGEDPTLWNEFENCFSLIDYDTIEDEASDFLQSYATENWSDSYHHDYQYEIEQITKDLSINLIQAFTEWITFVDKQIPNSFCVTSKIRLNPNAHFLTFNYTSTLAKIYNIPTEQTKHIHGSCFHGGIVLGHAYEIAPNQFTSQIDEDTDVRIAEGYSLIQDYFDRTLKPSQSIIETNAGYFKELQYASKVFVLGHSMSEVDKPYFDKISAVTRDIPWIVSYYEEESKDYLVRPEKPVSASTPHFPPAVGLSLCRGAETPRAQKTLRFSASTS